MLPPATQLPADGAGQRVFREEIALGRQRDRAAPAPADLADHEHLAWVCPGGEGAVCGAGTGRRAGHRGDLGEAASVEGGRSRYLDRPAPPTGLLTDHKCLKMVEDTVSPARGAVARRLTRH